MAKKTKTPAAASDAEVEALIVMHEAEAERWRGYGFLSTADRYTQTALLLRERQSAAARSPAGIYEALRQASAVDAEVSQALDQLVAGATVSDALKQEIARLFGVLVRAINAAEAGDGPAASDAEVEELVAMHEANALRWGEYGFRETAKRYTRTARLLRNRQPAAAPSAAAVGRFDTPLEQVRVNSRGHVIYRQDNTVGGHIYLCDDIGGGRVVLDTALDDPETLSLALAHAGIVLPPPASLAGAAPNA